MTTSPDGSTETLRMCTELSDAQFLFWIRDRLHYQYDENLNSDFMHRLFRMAQEAGDRESYMEELQMTDKLLDPRAIGIELRLNSIVETVDKLQLMTKEMSTQIDTLMSRSEDLKSWIEVNESRVHGLISLVSFLISKVPEEELGQDIKQLMTILAVDSVTQLRAEGFVPKSEQTGLDS